MWTFEQDNEFVDITYDWRLTAEKPLLRRLSSRDEADLRSKPPLGDGAGRGKPEAGAVAPPRDERCGAREHPAAAGTGDVCRRRPRSAAQPSSAPGSGTSCCARVTGRIETYDNNPRITPIQLLSAAGFELACTPGV